MKSPSNKWQLKLEKLTVGDMCYLICPEGHYVNGEICFSCLTFLSRSGKSVHGNTHKLFPPKHILIQYRLLCGQ